MHPAKTRRSMTGELDGRLNHTSYFLSGPDRPTVGRGVNYVPANFSEVPGIISRRSHRPLVLATVAESDGRLYWGTNAEYVAALVRDGIPAVLEVNAQMPVLPSCPAVVLEPVDEVNAPRRIAAQPLMVSICATTEVDLYGQCASATVGGCWYSGSGGQLEFMRGVHLAPDGQGFMVLRSTLRDGSSRIKPTLTPFSAVTTGVHFVDKVVTEHGIAELDGRSLSERARALIGIAAPEHRDELTFEAARIGIL
jgi:acyl-CoA hydrolase